MVSIMCENATIDFPIYDGSKNIRKDIAEIAIGGIARFQNNFRPIVRALDAINVNIGDGDRVGLIGSNGAGKTTLLRLMSGVYEPTVGNINVQGRLFPLLNSSPGLYLEDSGYENIYNCGLLLGMSSHELNEKTASIAEFSGLGEFLNFPVRTYSTGMQLRLIFAIATAIEPDILILDEIIGAGDAAFFDKASKRMENLVDRSSIVVLASHSIEILKKWCTRALVLDHGRIVYDGSIQEAERFYSRIVAVN